MESVIQGIPFASGAWFGLFYFWNHLIIYASAYDFGLRGTTSNRSVGIMYEYNKEGLRWPGATGDEKKTMGIDELFRSVWSEVEMGDKR